MKFQDILQAAADSSFVHPAGKKVPVTVSAAAYKQSKAGNPMIEVQLKVTGGPNAGKGRPLRTYLMLERDTSIQQITNFGVRKGELDQLASYDVEQAGERLAALLVGKRAAADIEQETYNNALQNRVKWVNPAAGATGPAPADHTASAEATQPGQGGNVKVEASELERLQRELAEAQRSAAPDDDLPF